MEQLSKFKLENTTRQQLISAYKKTHDHKNYPYLNSISLLLTGGVSPVDGSRYYPMPMYETMGHLPFGDEYKVGQLVSFDGLKIGLTMSFQEDVEEGVICLYNQLIRVLPRKEFDDSQLIDGICIDN